MADFSYLKSLKKPIAIAGLAVTGSAVVKACDEAGIPFHLWDDKQETRDDYAAQGYTIKDFSDDLSDYAFLVPTAGMKPSHPIIQKAIEQNIPIHSDVDLLYQSAPEATYIGITGTNGKSTTTALLGHILTCLEKPHVIGGNIGIAVASLPSFDKEGAYVLEMSSYQLDITNQTKFNIAVCLNITPDHLAWHGTMENYIVAKEKIFRTSGKKQTAILGTNTPSCQAIHEKLKTSAVHDVIDLSFPLPKGLDAIATLKGEHNQQNIAAAYAVCQKLGIADDDFIKAVQSFPGLIHRQQIVDTINGVTFINDSKATNADATSKALLSFNHIHWIIGGEDKDDGLNGLDKFYSKIKHAYLIGKASDRFANDLNDILDYTKCQTLDVAVSQTYKNAMAGDVVLFSPACASFDQYANFEKRGEHFIALVQNLKQKVS